MTKIVAKAVLLTAGIGLLALQIGCKQEGLGTVLNAGGSFTYDGVTYPVDGLNLLDNGANGTIPESYNLVVFFYTASPASSVEVMLDLNSTSSSSPSETTYNWAGVRAINTLFEATIDTGSGPVFATGGTATVDAGLTQFGEWFVVIFDLMMDTGKQATGRCEGVLNRI